MQSNRMSSGKRKKMFGWELLMLHYLLLDHVDGVEFQRQFGPATKKIIRRKFG